MSVEITIQKQLHTFSLDISFQSDAKRIAILGASGSGKSMTLKALTGIVRPDAGLIRIDDHIFFDSQKKINVKTQKRGVGYLFQNYALFPTMTVRQNIAAGLHEDAAKTKLIVDEMIKRFHLNGLEHQLPGKLSGGQQQRVALARIMAYAPSVILLDEPFSALDVYLKDQLQQELIAQLQQYDGTIIMVTHDRDEAYRFSDELVVIDNGTIHAHGPTKEIFRHPKSKTTARLTGCKNFSRAKRLDDYTVEAIDWGVTLHVKNPCPPMIAHLGYRAHEFDPIWGAAKENSIPFVLDGEAILPFEHNYYICPQKSDYQREDVLSWFAQRQMWPILEEKGMPDYLVFKESAMLFLEE